MTHFRMSDETTQPVPAPAPRPLPVPAPASVDAWVRARRTLMWALLSTVLATACAGLLAALPSVEWTADWWRALALKVAVDVLTAVCAYVGRHVVPPPTT